MLASPLPIYLGCAGLIVGTLGLGAHQMLGGGSGPSTNKDAAMPLFAKSVEQASLPATQWPSTNVEVAYYGPMVELLTQPTSSTPAPLADSSGVAPAQEQQPVRGVAVEPQSSTATTPAATAPAREESSAAPREVVRDLSPPPPSKQSRRAKNQRQRDDARSGNGETAATEQVDSREAREERPRQERQRTATQADPERREGRRSERRYRDRDDADEVDAGSRADRRGRDGERRVVVREEIRESDQRVVRGPEQRGPEQRDVGFSPFRLFGIFDQR